MKLEKLFAVVRMEGKVHSRLLLQIRLLLLASVIMLGVVVYQVLVYKLHLLVCVTLGAVSFLFGLLVFSKMNKPVWDEEKEIISMGRMDTTAFIILAFYFLFEIGLRTALEVEYGGTPAVIGYILCGVAPVLLGRALGTLIAVNKVAQTESIQTSEK